MPLNSGPELPPDLAAAEAGVPVGEVEQGGDEADAVETMVDFVGFDDYPSDVMVGIRGCGVSEVIRGQPEEALEFSGFPCGVQVAVFRDFKMAIVDEFALMKPADAEGLQVFLPEDLSSADFKVGNQQLLEDRRERLEKELARYEALVEEAPDEDALDWVEEQIEDVEARLARLE